MAKITLVSSFDGDWDGLYIDGTLVEQGHSLPAWIVIPLFISHTIESYESFEVDMSEDGYAREFLSDYTEDELEER